MGVYVLLGLSGVPVFTEGGGFWYILKLSFWKLMGICLVGLLIVYGAGMVYYYAICNYVIHTPIGVGTLFLYCFVLIVPGDIFLCVLSALVTKRIKPVLRTMGY